MKPETLNALGHIGFGLIIMALIGFPLLAVTSWTHAAWIAWGAQAMYWLGRERRDHEIKDGLNPDTEWWKGWNPLTWSLDGRRDLFWPVVVNAVIPLAISAVMLGFAQAR
jgi:hypothetical protein